MGSGKYKKQPHRHACLPAAISYVLGCDIQEIFDFLGVPSGFREVGHPSFTHSEMAAFCLYKGCSYSHLKAILIIDDIDVTGLGYKQYFDAAAAGLRNGLLIVNMDSIFDHALAVVNTVVLDPSFGRTPSDLDQLELTGLVSIDEIRST